MTDSNITTDVASCYQVTCAHNDALTCGLVRVRIDVDGKCMNAEPVAEDTDTTQE